MKIGDSVYGVIVDGLSHGDNCETCDGIGSVQAPFKDKTVTATCPDCDGSGYDQLTSRCTVKYVKHKIERVLTGMKDGVEVKTYSVYCHGFDFYNINRLNVGLPRCMAMAKDINWAIELASDAIGVFNSRAGKPDDIKSYKLKELFNEQVEK